MPEGTCDPASRGDQFNVLETAEMGGDVLISIRYGWDGVSTRETGCDGPIEDIHVRNISDRSYWAALPRKRRGNPYIEIPPGTDEVLSGGTLNSLGLQNYSDFNDIRLVDTLPS